nr:hypothetical protein BaRGS_034145 [Batillaria attramentaria]
MDPAGPDFQGYRPAVILDKTDAQFVDNIHTNGKTIIEGFHYAMTIHSGRGQDTKGTLSVKMAGTWGSSGLTKVTEEEEDLKSGVAYVGVFVSPVEVGSLKSLTVRYEKSPGRTFLHFGRGQDIYPVLSVDVTSGESGKT